MSHTPHELTEDFPDKRELIHDLKMSDAHFAQIADKYHELNRTVHRAETNVEPVDGLYMSELRKERMALKDEIARMLNDAIHAGK
jgi:uncharacterized protein YdcH (DUF465 family)